MIHADFVLVNQCQHDDLRTQKQSDVDYVITVPECPGQEFGCSTATPYKMQMGSVSSINVDIRQITKSFNR